MKLDFENKSEDVRIELIPLIDVIFCILIFFILAALQLTRQQAININLPQSNTSALQNRQTLIVSIDSIGQLYVDRTPVSEDQLYLLLEGYHRTNPQGLMLLNADRSAIYDDVVRVLDLMRSVGGDRVALATQPGQSIPGAASDPAGVFPGLPGATPEFPAPEAAPFEAAPPADNLDGLPALPDLDAPTTTTPAPGELVPPAADDEINVPGTGDFAPGELIPPS